MERASWIFVAFYLATYLKLSASEEECSPVYVRWARVRLNLTARVAGPYTLENCTRSCSKGDNPARRDSPMECSGFNHKQGANSLSHDCQLFQTEQLENVDGHIEADERYSFYWKYCAKTKKVCKSLYQFDFYIDRFMDSSEIQRTINTNKVEDCLSRCLDETTFTCRSISFNRTANVCSLSSQSQVSKPGYLRVNNNPNYRIDYYENNCFNESFTFAHDCRDNGIVVNVESKFPYTGALYGLYDFFTCRIEPKNETRFSLFFPYSTYSKNCTDSFSQKENNNVLDVVLSTDGMEPLYFLTDQDLLYQAKCPSSSGSGLLPSPSTIGATVVFLAPPSTISTSSSSTSDITTHSTAPPVTSPFSSLSSNSSSSSSTTEDFTLTKETSTKRNKATEDKSLELEKKQPATLPVIDITPNVKVLDSDETVVSPRGSKITVVVSYPHHNSSEFEKESSSDKVKTDSTSAEHTTKSSTPTTISTTSETTKTPSTTATSTRSTSTESENETTKPSSSKETSTESTTSTTPEATSTTSSSSSTASPSTSTFEVSTFTTTTSTPTATSTESSTSISTRSTKFGQEVIDTNPKFIIEKSSEEQVTKSFSKSTRSRFLSYPKSVKSDYDAGHESQSHEDFSTLSTRSSSTTSTQASTTKTSEVTKSTEGSTLWSTASASSSQRTQETREPFNSRFDPFEPQRRITAFVDISTDAPTTVTSTTSTTSSSTYKSTTNEASSVQSSSSSQSPSLTTVQSNETTTSITKGTAITTATLPSTSTAPPKIIFDIFHNGQPVNAVVVGSRVTLSFTSGVGIPAPYISLIGCQVEPVNSPFSWERDPLQIVKNGCQADGVGLVCPPGRTEFGFKVEMEAFRYTTTSEVLYSCLVRICAFNACPQPLCNPVDGCEASNSASSLLVNNRGRGKRQVQLQQQFQQQSQLQQHLQQQSPFLQQQQQLLPLVPSFPSLAGGFQQQTVNGGGFQPNLLGSAGDIVVSKKLVVVNSENELQYYLRTGNVPTNGNLNFFPG